MEAKPAPVPFPCQVLMVMWGEIIKVNIIMKHYETSHSKSLRFLDWLEYFLLKKPTGDSGFLHYMYSKRHQP